MPLQGLGTTYTHWGVGHTGGQRCTTDEHQKGSGCDDQDCFQHPGGQQMECVQSNSEALTCTCIWANVTTRFTTVKHAMNPKRLYTCSHMCAHHVYSTCTQHTLTQCMHTHCTHNSTVLCVQVHSGTRCTCMYTWAYLQNTLAPFLFSR